MNSESLIKNLADDISEIQAITTQLAGEHGQYHFVSAGPYEKIETKIEALLNKIVGLKRKYEHSPIKIKGFSITLGASFINSSASVNFEF